MSILQYEYGVPAAIASPFTYASAGFALHRSGDHWSAPLRVAHAEEQFEVDRSKICTAPRIRAAYLDSRRTILASLSHPLELKGGTDGFSLSPNLRIDSVREARLAEVSLLGYEFVETGRLVRFVLEPGRLGLGGEDKGNSNIYVSGSFNNWGNTVGGTFKPTRNWKMNYNPAARRYELTVPVGTSHGEVPPSGSEFKFTKDHGSGQDWYPWQNVPIHVGSAGKGVTEVLITLAEDAHVTSEYLLSHPSLRGTTVMKRGVLNDTAFIYTGNDLGHTYTPTGTKFRLWAPTVSGVQVLVWDSATTETATAIAEMQYDVGGTWVAEIPGNLRGKYYTFSLRTATQRLMAMDPYAVGAGVNGNRALILNWNETNPPGFAEHRRPAFGKYPTDAVLYEIHVRDLSVAANSGIVQKGKFLGFTETGTLGPGGVKTGLDHIKELGVTHVHLLPIFDFASTDETKEGQFNWGYDPKNYNVPEGHYATNPNGTARIKEFKQLVQTLHEHGLRVVMDVVYNHTYSGASPFELIAPTYYYRCDSAGRFSNGSGCGNETASERPMMRKYIVDSVKLWAREYKVDGFRFDLMGLHDVETMKAVRAALDEIDPSIIIYGEPWTGGPSALDGALRVDKGKQRGLNFAVFNDHIRNAIKGDNDGMTKGYATGAGSQVHSIQRGVVGGIAYDNWIVDFAKDPVETVNYASAHDNLTLWDKIAKSNGHDSLEDRIKMDLLAQAIVFTSQGIPFLQGGEEFLRSKGGNHNSYNAPDSVNQLDWSRKAQYSHVFAYYKGLIALRRAHPAFRLPTADLVRRHLSFMDGLPGDSLAFRLKEHAGGDPWRDLIVIYNPNREEVAISLPPGTWNVAARGTIIGEAGTVSHQAQVPPISMMLLYQP